MAAIPSWTVASIAPGEEDGDPVEERERVALGTGELVAAPLERSVVDRADDELEELHLVPSAASQVAGTPRRR